MQYMELTAANGVPFTFVYIPAGQAGPNPARHPADSDRATVEIYDARFKDGGAFHPTYGQFTSASYRAETFLGRDEWDSGEPGRYGLNIYGGVDDWTLDAATYLAAQRWVAQQHD